MKIMIIGGKTERKEDWEDIQKACFEIGKILCVKNHSLELCSPFEDSADYWVFKGYSSAGRNTGFVNFHYVKLKQVEERLQELEEQSIKINKIPTFVKEIQDIKEMQYAWLLCQLEALDSCQCIIAVGGKANGSANMLLRFAEGKRKMIVPLIWAGGAAQSSYDRRIYQLMDIFGDDLSLLNSRTFFNKVIEKIGIDRQEASKPIKERKIFISYARKRPYEADYIETLLRRRNIFVFRDESEFGAGEDIPIEIDENIHRANTFIAVYCAEYACSPWCYDELELALDLREKKQLDIWIICVDDTRIVSKRARNLIFYKVHNREEIEGKILELIMK